MTIATIVVKGKQDGKNICGDCYSHAMLNTYRKNMQAALQRNSDCMVSKTLLEGKEYKPKSD